MNLGLNLGDTMSQKVINWYPGHMEKARRQMIENLKAVDFIIEVRDARIPNASKNPMLNELAQNKKKLIILSKKDLADENVTKEWARSIEEEGSLVLVMNLQKDKNIKQDIVKASKELTKEIRDRMIAKGIRPRAMRAMACGIPNSGKSTLINRIAGKNRARVEDRPGVTRGLSWIQADESLDILDTPGVLWPKFEDQKTGILLAATGAINEDVVDVKEIAKQTIQVIRNYYPNLLESFFHTDTDIETIHFLNAIAKDKNFLKENRTYDELRSAHYFLTSLRKGDFGSLSLEKPNENTEEMSK